MTTKRLEIALYACVAWAAASLTHAAPGDAGRAAGCPMSLPVGEMQQSMSEPITHYGSAAAAMSALQASVDDLQSQYDAICDRQQGLNSAEECNRMRRLISDSRRLVDGMACHVRAEASAATGGSKGAASKSPADMGAGSPGGSVAPKSGSGSPPGADGFLGFGDKGNGGSGKGAGDFLGFEGSDRGVPKNSGAGTRTAKAGSGGHGQPQVVGNDSFPTPQCQFLSDVSERHDANALVCVGKQVYECVSRSAMRPVDAWSRISGAGSCGKVRTIEAVEQDRRQLKDLARQKWLSD